jgi:hypothetical protein
LLNVAFVWIWWHAKKFFHLYKKIRKRFSDWRIENWMKMMNRKSRTWWKFIIQFIIQRIVFEFFHTNEKIFLHVIKFIQKWHLAMIVWKWFIEKKERADFILIKFSISQFIIFIKFSTSSIKESFSDFFIQMKKFLCMSSNSYKSDINDDRKYYKEWYDDRDRELDENQVCKACFAIIWFTLLVRICLKYWVMMITKSIYAWKHFIIEIFKQ